MRQLIVCCDGTWNRADESVDGVPTPTNVRLFHNALAATDADGREQIPRYFSGVGTDGSRLTRTIDGTVGHGLSANIMNAYRWLTGAYAEGDLISLIGFSRGAFTVRSLVGMLTGCGLLAPGPAGVATWDDVRRVFHDGYVDLHTRPADWHADLRFHAGFGPDRPAVELGDRIAFLGVWETVGGLGIPESLAVLDLLDDERRFRFHDTTLNPGVRRACHALALDERRGPFAPTPWTTGGEITPDSDQLTQRWFPGVHSDVGGGYRETGLSDGALAWMMREAEGGPGLRFRAEAWDDIHPDPRDVLHDSCVGVYEHLAPLPRNVPCLSSETVHASARERMARAPLAQYPYRPTTVLEVGEEHHVEIFARQPWNETGLYLERGTYTFAATGEWTDGDDPAGPDGIDRLSFTHAIGELLSHVERAVRIREPGAEMPFTARADDQRWMQLIGVVASGGAHSSALEVLPLGTGPLSHHVSRPGYLYAFANDAWETYGNNRGGVRLTVTCTGRG